MNVAAALLRARFIGSKAANVNEENNIPNMSDRIKFFSRLLSRDFYYKRLTFLNRRKLCIGGRGLISRRRWYCCRRGGIILGSQMLCIRCRDLSNYGRRVHRSFMEAARLPSRPLNNDSSVSSKRMGIFQIRDVYFDHEIHEKKSQSFSLVFYDCLCSMFQNSKNNERSGISRLLVAASTSLEICCWQESVN